MTPMRRTTSANGSQSSRTPRCGRTMLTKPECHCPACLAEQISAHAPVAQHAEASGGALRIVPASA
jgi:hypothetical protein